MQVTDPGPRRRSHIQVRDAGHKPRSETQVTDPGPRRRSQAQVRDAGHRPRSETQVIDPGPRRRSQTQVRDAGHRPRYETQVTALVVIVKHITISQYSHRSTSATCVCDLRQVHRATGRDLADACMVHTDNHTTTSLPVRTIHVSATCVNCTKPVTCVSDLCE